MWCRNYDIEIRPNNICEDYTISDPTREELPEEQLATLQKINARMAERQAAVRELRILCGRVGDNDWPDELDLGDIIGKHLAKYLVEKVF